MHAYTRRPTFGLCLSTVIVVGLTATVQARPAYLKLFIATYKPVPALQTCATCHIAPKGKGPRNPFGTAFENAGHTVEAFQLIAQLDSDGDGVDNASEIALGSLPGDAASKPVVGEAALFEDEDAAHALGRTPGEGVVMAVLYDGEGTNPLNVTPAPWGGGSVESTDEYKLGQRPKALKGHVKGQYEGLRFDLGKPVDLTPFEDGGYLVITARFGKETQSSTTTTEQAGPGSPGGTEDLEGYEGEEDEYDEDYEEEYASMEEEEDDEISEEDYESMMEEYGRGGGGAGEEGTKEEEEKKTKIGSQTTSFSNFRILFQRDKGMMALNPYPLRPDRHDGASGWTEFSIPVKLFKSSRTAAGALRRLILCADAEDDIIIGQVVLEQDAGPIEAQLKVGDGAFDDITVNAGDPVEFWVDTKPRLANLKYAVDFDASDGITEDAVLERADSTVQHVYEKPGTYTATLTVSDKDELLETQTSTFKVIVQ